MNRNALVVAVVLLAACAPAATRGGGSAVESTLPGLHAQVEGVDIWADTVPPRAFRVVERDARLAIEPLAVGSAAAGSQSAVFPAMRMAAIVAAVRAEGGDAALVRTRETSPATAPAGLFGGYEYEVDVIRYRAD